ncbi:patellin-6-like isoform X1 [Musa acuminata AAA Group]|uniref:patellin-6-like isoform X1 n=1 Tax=Musa acuminata AAA Group TaxID=214697 RepID=UPI0031DD6A8B
MESSQATTEPVPSPNPATKRSLLSSLMEATAGATAAPTALHVSHSFKEDCYLLSSLKLAELKALQELQQLLAVSPKPISIWGVPLAPSSAAAGDERAVVVLLKFLRARDFDAGQAHAMLLRCVEWRREFGADEVAEEELVGFKELEGVVAYMHGWDRWGHPVCYNAYGVFKDKDVYDRVLGDADKLHHFLRWRVQVMERGVRLLQLRPGGINSIIQVTDLKDMPKRELRAASQHILSLFQDNYPEMVARKVFINVPWYFTLLYAMISPFLTERTKSKFVIARESNVAETLYKCCRFIRPEFVPVQYGGLSRPGDLQNGPPKPATEFTIKGGERVNLEIDGIEGGASITWDIAVGGWDVDYGAEYVPSDGGSYTIIVEKTRRVPATADEPIHNVYTAREVGKMVLSIDNTNSRRRKVAAYRYFVRKPCT